MGWGGEGVSGGQDLPYHARFYEAIVGVSRGSRWVWEGFSADQGDGALEYEVGGQTVEPDDG